MKQGQASREGPYGQKVEPKSVAIAPAWTNQMGVSYGTHTTEDGDVSGGQSPMTTGPGLRAPMVSHRTSNCGTQGKR